MAEYAATQQEMMTQLILLNIKDCFEEGRFSRVVDLDAHYKWYQGKDGICYHVFTGTVLFRYDWPRSVSVNVPFSAITPLTREDIARAIDRLHGNLVKLVNGDMSGIFVSSKDECLEAMNQ